MGNIMIIETRDFGTVEIEDEKVIHFPQGIPGFDEYKDYVILYDHDGEEQEFFSCLQCATEQGLAFPVVDPFHLMDTYNPMIEDDLLEPLGEFTDEDLMVLLLATVPADVKKTSVNMKAPILINVRNHQAMQVIVENDDYQIKHMLIAEDKELPEN